jgi:hypothetical protein
MRLASERTDLEWPDAIGSKRARAALLFYFADRYAELIEWVALQCDAAEEPLTQTQRVRRHLVQPIARPESFVTRTHKRRVRCPSRSPAREAQPARGWGYRLGTSTNHHQL